MYLLAILFAGIVIFLGYNNGIKSSAPLSNPEDGNPVYISESLFCNRDSVMYWYEQGLLHNDPKGLYVIGVAARLRVEHRLPDDIYAPSIKEGDEYLLLSAELGYPDAIQAIYCLHKHGYWYLNLPNENN